MFLASKTIDISHTQTIDVPTLEAGMGVVRLRGHLYISHMFGHPIHVDTPHISMLQCTFVCF